MTGSANNDGIAGQATDASRHSLHPVVGAHCSNIVEPVIFRLNAIYSTTMRLLPKCIEHQRMLMDGFGTTKTRILFEYIRRPSHQLPNGLFDFDRFEVVMSQPEQLQCLRELLRVRRWSFDMDLLNHGPRSKERHLFDNVFYDTIETLNRRMQQAIPFELDCTR